MVNNRVVTDVEVGCLGTSRSFQIVGSKLLDGDHSQTNPLATQL